MAIREIVKEGDSALSKVCRPIENFDRRLALLIEDLYDTLEKADGCGLAAPQVGILRRVVVVVLDDQKYELVNPRIIAKSGEQEETEGCLSIPNVWGLTKRPEWVRVRAQDRNGEWHDYEGNGLLARAFCHELDHLDGVLFREHVTKYIDPEKERA